MKLINGENHLVTKICFYELVWNKIKIVNFYKTKNLIIPIINIGNKKYTCNPCILKNII